MHVRTGWNLERGRGEREMLEMAGRAVRSSKGRRCPLSLSLFLLSTPLFLFILSSFSMPPFSSSSSTAALLRLACSATRHPVTCHETLSRHNPLRHSTPLDLIRTSVRSAIASLSAIRSAANSILAAAGGDPDLANAAQNCRHLLSLSAYRLGLVALPETLSSRVKDALAWLSAGLTFQYDCWSALKYVNTSDQIGSAMADLDSLMALTSNALSMVLALDRFGPNTRLWRPPETERDGLLASAGRPTRTEATGLFRRFEGLKPDVVVCKDGVGGCLGSVQAAVDSAPENSSGIFVIKIKEGLYEEIVRVPVNKRNVVFWGDGVSKTVITGSRNAKMVGVTTYNTATVGIDGDGFMASGITFQNTAGSDSRQAVAFRSDSDLSIIDNCEFLGHQDTVYAHTLRQFYRSCRIQGTIDFIFGNAAAVFHNCTILVAPRSLSHLKGEKNALTAHGRTDPAQSTGFVFENCLVNGTEKYMGYFRAKPAVHRNFLGRPWKEYARTVFLNCCLESLIRPEGWLPWRGDFALKTLYYAEFGNFGAGANISKRVPWSSVIPAQNLYMYSVEGFIQGDKWIMTSEI